jgi:hypothetical protein
MFNLKVKLHQFKNGTIAGNGGVVILLSKDKRGNLDLMVKRPERPIIETKFSTTAPHVGAIGLQHE